MKEEYCTCPQPDGYTVIVKEDKFCHLGCGKPMNLPIVEGSRYCECPYPKWVNSENKCVKCGELIREQEKGRNTLGLIADLTWHRDPKHLLFLLARYKFVAKMLKGKKKVLEVGCGDAFGTRLVLQEVEKITAIDINQTLIDDVLERMGGYWRFHCRNHNIVLKPMDEEFEAAYCLDVIEHIPKEQEESFMFNIARSLKKEGSLIIGTPSIQSQKYTHPDSKKGHVNCKNYDKLKALMLKFFENAFVFSMNDEVVHTGFYPMAHYLLILGVGKK